MKKFVILFFMIITSLSLFAQDNPISKGIDLYNRDDFNGALRYLQPLAKQGNAEAQFYVGWCYLRKDIKPDLRMVLKQWEQAATQNYPNAMHCMAQLYEYSDRYGTKVNIPKALALYKKSAELGNPNSLFILSEFYLNGEHVEKDTALAFAYCKKAAEKNDQFRDKLGDYYYDGIGTPLSIDSAFVAYSSCYTDMKDRQPISLYRLAVMYYEGKGTKANPIKAQEIIRHLVSRGYQPAKTIADKVYTAAHEAELIEKDADKKPKEANSEK